MRYNNYKHLIYNKNYMLLLIILTVLFILLLASIFPKYQSYFCSPDERPIYHTIKHKDDTLRIAYIGDSWAMGHQNHLCNIVKSLEDSLGRPTLVESYGIGGLTSKEIYHAFFEIKDFKDFIKKGYDFCFISAGINDASKKMSTEYYTKSMDYIIRFLLVNNITPIILEIPDFNITKVFKEEKLRKKIIRYLSMIVNRTDIDSKQEYRDALKKLIKDKYKNRVSVIPYQSWNNNYESDLKRLYISDELHLNNIGYLALDSVIVSEITRFEKHKPGN